MFVASIVKIGTLNMDVLESEWTLTSRALRLVCTWQQMRMCASFPAMQTNMLHSQTKLFLFSAIIARIQRIQIFDANVVYVKGW